MDSSTLSDTSNHNDESSHQSGYYRRQKERINMIQCKHRKVLLIIGLIAILSSRSSLRLLVDPLYELKFDDAFMDPNQKYDDNTITTDEEDDRVLNDSASEMDDIDIGAVSTKDPSISQNIQNSDRQEDLNVSVFPENVTKEHDLKEDLNIPVFSDNTTSTESAVTEEENTNLSLDPHEIQTGVLSTKDPSFFRNIQAEIDREDNDLRCKRYDGYYNAEYPKNRRIFYGSLIANEPWELFEIVSAETYGIYAGMVFVEGNRTQNFTPRPFTRLSDGPKLAELFGIDEDKVQVRTYVEENEWISGLAREHRQRAEILVGWKELGMQPDDVALLADSDETFTRDFLRAIQVCDGIPALDYEKHYCHHSKVKIRSKSRVFESSPECTTENRSWFHPDMIIGHCVEGISQNPINQPAPRTKNSFLRARGFGKNGCGDWNEEKKIGNNAYPLWNAADFRRTCAGRTFPLRAGKQPDRNFDLFSGYHFHNFFSTFNNTRFKHLTYGHSNKQALIEPIESLSNDLKMMHRCIKDMQDDNDQKWKRVQGGFANLNPWLPIYFQDDDYRRRRHEYVKDMVQVDEAYLASLQSDQETEQPDESSVVAS